MLAFFLLAICPMILGGILLAIFIFVLKREGRKPATPESKRITPREFIDDVAQYSNIGNGEAEKIIEFVFSYFPEFNWRNELPVVKGEQMYTADKEKRKKIEEKRES